MKLNVVVFNRVLVMFEHTILELTDMLTYTLVPLVLFLLIASKLENANLLEVKEIFSF